MNTFFVRGLFVAICALALAACSGSSSDPDPNIIIEPPIIDQTTVVDIRDLVPGDGFARISGSASTGRFGVPVAGGVDVDGDGFQDVAMSNMQAAPFGRVGAGQALIIFGDGTFNIGQDTATPGPNVLIIAGAAQAEAAAGELWFADVTGDGLGDLLLGRQNYREPVSGRIGAGALSIVVGSPMLRDLARNGQILDLAAPPAGINIFTLVGANELDRLGFWMRAGDASGDGIDDLLVGADQQDFDGDVNAGVAWLVRGGAHLDANQTVDLAQFGSTALSGQIARIEPPVDADDYHFGATVALADLDANGVSEVLVSAALSRVGGLLVADGAAADTAVRVGGNPGGSLFIFWDDNFSASTWPAGFSVRAGQTTGGYSRIDGGVMAGRFTNDRFGEEVIGNFDYTNDGLNDLFVGDITGESSGLVRAGVGHIFIDTAALRGIEMPVQGFVSGQVVHLSGLAASAISSDTAATSMATVSMT